MGGASIKVNLDELKIIKKYVNKLEHINFNELLDGVGALLTRQTQRTIKTGKVDSKGIAWEKRKDNKVHPLLVNTGGLFESIHYIVKGSKVLVGSNLKYAATHQYGDHRTIKSKSKKGLNFEVKRNIPRREYLYLRSRTKKLIKKLIITFYEGK